MALAGAKGIQFWGCSIVLGPKDEILAHASTDKPEILLAKLDLQRSEQVRRIWPFLRDRRVDAYGDLLRRFRVLTNPYRTTRLPIACYQA